MMKINDSYALLALLICAVIYFYLKKQDIRTSYGDAKRGYVFKGIINSLKLLEGSKAHPKNWRPVLVTLSADPCISKSAAAATGKIASPVALKI